MSRHTSENAGALIFRYFFHVSPSDAIMLGPNMHSARYRSIALGKDTRAEVMCFKLVSAEISANKECILW